MTDFRVVICGGGIAAVEGLLRLRRLLGDSVRIQLVAPNDELVYRPLAVREPFAFGGAKRYRLKKITSDTGAEWIRDTLSWIDPDGQILHTGERQELEYDALLVAIGARQVDPYEHVSTFHDAQADEVYNGIVRDVEEGYTRSVAFVLPVGPVWPLPLYELALMTAERAYSQGIDDLELTIVTPEREPLAIFGEAATQAASEALESARITVYRSALAQVPRNRSLLIQPQGVELSPDRIVSLPRISGPSVRGLAGGGAQGFVPIDKHCCVPGTNGHVFAAGDAVAYPIKHGGLGAQMADTAAAAIAKLAGADVDAAPFNPVIKGKLLTGKKPIYLKAHLVGAEGFESEVYETPPWPEDDKIVAEELGPYLAGLDSARTA